MFLIKEFMLNLSLTLIVKNLNIEKKVNNFQEVNQRKSVKFLQKKLKYSKIFSYKKNPKHNTNYWDKGKVIAYPVKEKL